MRGGDAGTGAFSERTYFWGSEGKSVTINGVCSGEKTPNRGVSSLVYD